MGGYLVTTLLFVVPALRLRAAGSLPTGALTLLAFAVAVPASVLTELGYAAPAVGAVLATALFELILGRLAWLSDPRLFAAGLPGALWSGQLIGLAASGRLAWPVEMWAGVLVLSMLVGYGLSQLSATPTRQRVDLSGATQ